MNGENTARVPPTAGSGEGGEGVLKETMQKNTGPGIPQHTETNSFSYTFIPPGLLTVPPAGSCHSTLGPGMCPVPIPG